MKKYNIIVTILIVIGFTIIGVYAPANLLSKTTGFISENYIEQENKLTICIDPGHQQKGDPKLEPVAPGSYEQKARVSSGATGIATKKPEYILNLEASLILKEILEKNGYNVIMTRQTHGVNISNSERATFANNNNANLVVRIHADSLNDSSKTGASILIPAKEGKYTKNIYEVSNNYALCVKESMQNNNIKINGIFERDDLSGFNWSKVPVILVEMGFLSNYNEDLMMSDLQYQKKLMGSIVEGIQEYEEKN